MHVSIINYRNNDKLVCFIFSFVAFVTQAKNNIKKHLCNPSSHNRKYGEYAREMRPKRLIIGKPINQYASYSAMFCPLHCNIGKEQHEKYLYNPSSHYGKYGEYNILVKHVPHISIRESHNASISVMSNSFHNIVSKA